MMEPCFPLPVRAFSAVGFDSRKGQPLESRASRDLRDTASCAHAAGVSRSGRSLPTIRISQAHYFKAWPPVFPVSLSSSIPPRPIPPPSNWRNGMAWSRCSRLHACIQRDPPLSGLIAVSVLRLSSSVKGLRRLRVGRDHGRHLVGMLGQRIMVPVRHLLPQRSFEWPLCCGIGL